MMQPTDDMQSGGAQPMRQRQLPQYQMGGGAMQPAGQMRMAPPQQNRWGSYGGGMTPQPTPQPSAPVEQVQPVQQPKPMQTQPRRTFAQY